jgi:hypothetical protein
MKDDQDYIRDIAEMRSMMERTSKFMSLSGLAGVMAGLYALTGAVIAYLVFDFPAVQLAQRLSPGDLPPVILQIILLAILVLVMSVGTAIFLSSKKAGKNGERIWNATSRRLLINMAVPLVSGGLLILIVIARGMIDFIAPFTLIFYGLALYNASRFTYEEVRSLGIIQIVLGLISSFFVEYGLVAWALGFGLFHIIYGIYMHYRYER